MAIDKRYIKKEAVLKPVKRIVAILCIAAIISAVLICTTKELNYQMIAEKEIHISSGTDIQLRGKGMYNDTIYLTKDISVNENAQIGSVDHPFEGIFDGKGHTVYLDYSNADADTSFFNYISPNAVVRNVTFVYENVAVDGHSFGGVAKINDGTIENCKVEFSDIKLYEEGLFSPFVTVNRGTITNVVAHGKVSSVAQNAKEEKMLYGSICVYNSGTLSSVISDIEYTGFTCTSLATYNDATTDNVSVSAVRYDDLEGGKTEKALAIVPADQISSDREDSGIKLSDRSEVYTYKTFIEELLFNADYWDFDGDDVKTRIKK